MARPPLELPCIVHDEGDHVWLDIKFPPPVRMEWLLSLYILRYEKQPFTITLSGARRIITRIVMRPELERPGRAEWGRDELVLLLETDELDYWIHAFRRWYEGVWDVYTPPHLDVGFDRGQTNLRGGFDLVLGPGTDRDPGREPKRSKHRRDKRR